MKEELELDEETKAILNDPEAMKRIRQAKKDIEEGRTKEITSVQDLLDELDEE